MKHIHVHYTLLKSYWKMNALCISQAWDFREQMGLIARKTFLLNMTIYHYMLRMLKNMLLKERYITNRLKATVFQYCQSWTIRLHYMSLKFLPDGRLSSSVCIINSFVVTGAIITPLATAIIKPLPNSLFALYWAKHFFHYLVIKHI